MEDKRPRFKEGEDPAQQAARWQAPDTLLAGVEHRLNQREAYLSSPHAWQELVAALHDEQWEIRSAAVEALSTTGSPEGMPFIREALHDEHHLVRLSAVQALGKLEAPLSVHLLLAAAQDDDWQVREMVMLTLGALEAHGAEDPLKAGLRDPVSNVREAAQHALQRLQQRGKDRSNGHSSASALTREDQPSQKQERNPTMTTKSPQPTQAGHTTHHQEPEQAHRRFRHWRMSMLAAVAVLALALMGAGIVRWVWNPVFGSPDLYQTINQQQTNMGVTITLTRAYADEGRTIIAFDVAAPGTNKTFVAGNFDLTSPTPQQQAGLTGTACDAPQEGITHCYMIQPAFLVPTGDNTLSLRLEIRQVIQTGTPDRNIISGGWHFSFTVPFHHENRQDIPNPIS